MMEAIFEYAQYQAIPDFEDNLSLALVWDFLRPKLDRDGERYERAALQKHYACYCRGERRSGREPIPFDEWLDMEDAPDLSADIGRLPTTTTTSTPTTKTSSSTTAAADTTAAAATTNIYQLTAPQPESKLSPRQQEAEFEALRRERIQAVAGWKGS